MTVFVTARFVTALFVRVLFVRALFLTFFAIGAAPGALAGPLFFAFLAFVRPGRALRLARTAERSLEIKVRAEFIVVRGGWRGRAFGARIRVATFGPLRASRPIRLPLGGLAGGALAGLRLGRRRLLSRRRWLVEQQVLGRDLRLSIRLGTQIDAEQIFSQGFPGILFAA
jgi:hypothetical protein